MALLLRTGTYGNYWGDEYDSSHSLTTEQQQINASYIWSSLSIDGWSLNAVCGMLRKHANRKCNKSSDVGNLILWVVILKVTVMV